MSRKLGLDLRNLAVSQRRQALVGEDISGVVFIAHGHHAVLRLPNAVDDLIEEPAVVDTSSHDASSMAYIGQQFQFSKTLPR